MSTIEKLIPLQTLLRRLLDTTNVTLGEHEVINSTLNKAAQQAGTQPGSMFVVKETTKKNGQEPSVRYDLGFHDTHPENSGELITLQDAMSRDWDPTNRPPVDSRAKKEAGDDSEESARPSILQSVFTP